MDRSCDLKAVGVPLSHHGLRFRACKVLLLKLFTAPDGAMVLRLRGVC